jgi:transcriptional regulator with XRE-family HTH domain
MLVMAELENRSTVASRVKAARRRAGMSREQLAVDSGLSWSAITQIEAGRRPNPRAYTLGALAPPLGVSVDYLLGNRSPGGDLLDHQSLIYLDAADLVETAAPFLQDGVEHGEAVLVVANPENAEPLRDRLGASAAKIRFGDWPTWYGSPRDALLGYRQFAIDALDAGAPWVRIVGEPVWADRTAEEIETWVRYEALINLAFAALPMSLVCPYNETALDPAIIGNARATHCRCLKQGESPRSPEFVNPLDLWL